MAESVLLLFLVVISTAVERYFLLMKKDTEIQRLTNLLASRSSIELEQISRLGHPQAQVQVAKKQEKPKFRMLPDNL